MGHSKHGSESIILKESDSWYAEARRRWLGTAEWVTGEGPFALVEPCRVLTIQLFPTRDEALMAKFLVDGAGCGDGCLQDHRLVNLADGY